MGDSVDGWWPACGGGFPTPTHPTVICQSVGQEVDLKGPPMKGSMFCGCLTALLPQRSTREASAAACKATVQVRRARAALHLLLALDHGLPISACGL